MATVKETLAKIESHERECNIRYTAIEKRLDKGDAKFDRLDTKFTTMIIGVYVLIIGSSFLQEVIMAKAEKQAPQVINFDGKQYDISKMTDRVAEQFNMLVRLQSEWQDASFNLKKVEAAQKTVVTELQVFMKEDNIKAVDDRIITP